MVYIYAVNKSPIVRKMTNMCQSDKNNIKLISKYKQKYIFTEFMNNY